MNLVRRRVRPKETGDRGRGEEQLKRDIKHDQINSPFRQTNGDEVEAAEEGVDRLARSREDIQT